MASCRGGTAQLVADGFGLGPGDPVVYRGMARDGSPVAHPYRVRGRLVGELPLYGALLRVQPPRPGLYPGLRPRDRLQGAAGYGAGVRLKSTIRASCPWNPPIDCDCRPAADQGRRGKRRKSGGRFSRKALRPSCPSGVW